MKKNITSWICGAGALLASATVVQATPTLFIWDSTGTQMTIVDNNAPDGNPLPGLVTFAGAFDSVWTVVADAGTTYPAAGSLTRPEMDLSFNNLSSTAGGTIHIAFFGNGFGPTALGNALATIGGTGIPTGATLTYQTFTQGSQSAPTFGAGGLDLSSFGSALTTQVFGPGLSFSGSATGPSISGGLSPYSLLQEITLTTPGSSDVTGNSHLTVPDGGTTLMLLGSSLTALGLLRRSFKKS